MNSLGAFATPMVMELGLYPTMSILTSLNKPPLATLTRIQCDHRNETHRSPDSSEVIRSVFTIPGDEALCLVSGVVRVFRRYKVQFCGPVSEPSDRTPSQLNLESEIDTLVC